LPDKKRVLSLQSQIEEAILLLDKKGYSSLKILKNWQR